MNTTISPSYANIVDAPAIIKTLIWISLGGSLAVSLAFWFYNGIQGTSLSLLVISGFCIILLFINQAGFYELAGLLLYLVISIVLTYIISVGYAIYDAGMLVYPLLIVLSSLTFGKRTGLLVTSITILEIGFISILGEAGYIRPFNGAVPQIFLDSITSVVILISTYLLIWIMIDLMENAVKKIVESEEELEIAFDMTLEAWAKGTDCYPRKHIKTKINIHTINEFNLFNPRNAYQNYNVAVNSTKKMIHTYMGTLLPNLRNATYSTSGELSPLLNDPEFKTIGLGTRIFLGGTQGFVVWPGTQFHTTRPKNELGVPVTNAATIAVMGNLKEMSSEYIQAATYEKYGVSMFVGIGIPIPILNADIAKSVSINNSQIETSVLDYGTIGTPKLGQVSYEELQTGTIKVKGKKIRTAPVASLSKARKIAGELKKWLQNGEFEVSKPVQMFPTNTSLNSLKETEAGND
jgi:uncharacterized protein (DUF39 family)